MLREYANRVAVVTGAASGLGEALARELARRKCHLALVDVNSRDLARVAAELTQFGTIVTQHRADVASESAVQAVAAAVATAHSGVHLLINNAGISVSAPFCKTAPAAFERLLQVNLLGVVYCCRAFLPLLQQESEGQILNVASCFAWLGCPRKTAYAASKGAVRAFSESLRLEFASTRVGISVLYPGPLRTNLVRNGISDSDERRRREEQFLAARGLRPEVVARRCLDALPRNPGRIVVGRLYHALDIIARLSPGLAGRLTGAAAARAGF